jgi:dihydrofolate synthase/folylpolyglutamate synthase
MSDPEAAYNRALDYLYSFVDYSLKHSSELAKADFNLDRMRVLMAGLGNPQEVYPILHVAGTKGKGSVCALAASGLHAAGYRVGLYTSPHLLDYCERIQVDGQPVSHEDLTSLIEEVKSEVSRIPKLTTFEITTALALLHFAREKAEVAVLEVGLGGRLDATNIVLPLTSVITSLSYDHMAVLGDTLAKIAGEKAGIIKAGVPVVSAPQTEEALRVLIRIADERGAPFTLVGRDVTFSPLGHTLDGQSLHIAQGDKGLTVTMPLLGAHQVQNAATAAAALWSLRGRGLGIPDAAIKAGFANVLWPARFDVVRREPPVILDSAHNQDSFARLRQALDDYFPGRLVYLIFGASEDKNIAGMFAEIKSKTKHLFITQADHPRALPPESIVRQAELAQIPYAVVTPVRAAFARALDLSRNDGSIALSAGSMFVTAEALAAWNDLGLDKREAGAS